jgi:hypothetical protein
VIPGVETPVPQKKKKKKKLKRGNKQYKNKSSIFQTQL